MEAATGARPILRARAHALSGSGLGAVAVAAWALLIVVAWAWGNELRGDGARILLDAPPLFGQFDVQIVSGGLWSLLPVATAAAIVLVAPLLVRRLSWRYLLSAAVAAAAAWAFALALTEGTDGITAPLETPSGYLTAVGSVGSPGEFLSTFTERIDGYATHVRSHPPGMALVLEGLDRVGIGGSAPAALLIVTVAATTAAAALIALRSVADEQSARRAAPFLILVPGAVWIATTADALFMAVGAWSICLLALAIAAEGHRSDLLALGGGLLFGVAIFLSFGLVLLAIVPVAVAVAARRVRPLAIAVAATAAVALVFLAAGYWWLDGFHAAREQYFSGVAKTRPYDFFLVSNLAAFAFATGPATAIALARLRDPRVWLLVGGGAGALALAWLSGMSKAEVERIWLPFLPWIMLAAASLPTRVSSQRMLLGVQATSAIAIQLGVATIW